MGLIDKFRKKSAKSKLRGKSSPQFGEPFRSSRPTRPLPAPVLKKIFSFLCPHVEDESYETCERSAVEDACMLCDLRDLAHAAAVCRSWNAVAETLL